MNNPLVPPDQLNWDASSKTYKVLSSTELNSLIESCFRTGLHEFSDITKVVREYERVRSGHLLFEQFLSGKIGIYEFDDEGSPIFESLREKLTTEVWFESRTEPFESSVEIMGRFVRCVKCKSNFFFNPIELYESVVEFCTKWEIDIMSGENPEEASLTINEPKFIFEFMRRSWNVISLDIESECVSMKVGFRGAWLRTDHDD